MDFKVEGRAYEADDNAMIYVNGVKVVNAVYGKGPDGKDIYRPGDSGWVDITPYAKEGNNEFRFVVWNDGGAVSGLFQIKVNGILKITRDFRGEKAEDFSRGIKYDEKVSIELP